MLDKDHAVLFVETFAALFDAPLAADGRRAAIKVVDAARKRKQFEQLHHCSDAKFQAKLYLPKQHDSPQVFVPIQSLKRKATAGLDERRVKHPKVEELPDECAAQKSKRGRPPKRKPVDAPRQPNVELKQEPASTPAPLVKGKPGRVKVKMEDVSSLSDIPQPPPPTTGEVSRMSLCPSDCMSAPVATNTLPAMPTAPTFAVKDEASESPLHDGFKSQIHLMGLPADCTPPSNRLPCPTQPPIWAESRQELCEAFSWFRSYQGGVYFSNEFAKGYLLSKHASLFVVVLFLVSSY